MYSPYRVTSRGVSAASLYLVAAVVLWVAAVVLGVLTSSQFVAALNFVAGLIFLLLWQARSGAPAHPSGSK